ncbi:MAG: FixH family protein [Bacteroidota bacterium]
MSWKYKIAALYIGFVAVILSGVIASTGHKYQLVRTDYYEAEVNYQSRIDEMHNQALLEEKPLITQSDHAIVFTFPTALQNASGEINLYRPSDHNLDQKLALQLADGQQVLDKASVRQGHWIVQLSYQQDGTKYYQEQSIVVK